MSDCKYYTEIHIKAEMTDEQLNALADEITRTAGFIGIKLESLDSELVSKTKPKKEEQMKIENLQKAIDLKEQIDSILDYNNKLKTISSYLNKIKKSIDIPFPNGLTGKTLSFGDVDIIIPADIILKHTELNIAANEERIKFLESEFESL